MSHTFSSDNDLLLRVGLINNIIKDESEIDSENDNSKGESGLRFCAP